MCCKYFREYNETTSIHGLHYLTDRRTKFEKIFWICILLFSLSGCVFMIYKILKKYHDTPVVINFATVATPIYEVPFPDVTICPETKCIRSRFNYSDIYYKIKDNEEISTEESKLFYYMAGLCDQGYEIYETNNGTETLDFEDFFNVINELKPHFPMNDCTFMGINYSCSEIFIPVITDQGICYSFNILDRHELFRDQIIHHRNFYSVINYNSSFDGDGYGTNTDINTYPRRALMSGVDNSLEIYFSQNRSDIDFICKNFIQGYRVLIHNPLDIPRLSKSFLLLPHNKASIAAILPELIQTSDDVKEFSPETRHCYLKTERPLKYFKVYTQSNCQLECLTNYTLNKCHCVGFYMPRDKKTEICGSKNSRCMLAAENDLKAEELGNKIAGLIKKNVSYCNCKPLCSGLQYNMETSQSEFFWPEYLRAQRNQTIINLNEQENLYVSNLIVYFKSEQFMTLERNQLYGISDLISNFGGLLGLFTGFSLISLAEIFYFLSLRICCNWKLYGSWTGPPCSNYRPIPVCLRSFNFVFNISTQR